MRSKLNHKTIKSNKTKRYVQYQIKPILNHISRSKNDIIYETKPHETELYEMKVNHTKGSHLMPNTEP